MEEGGVDVDVGIRERQFLEQKECIIQSYICPAAPTMVVVAGLKGGEDGGGDGGGEAE